MSLKKLGRYELIRVLGKGAMGVVYEGRDPNLDRRVAIKTVKVENLSEEAAAEYEARFRTEARSAARLQHPNIVSVYDSDRDGDIAFLVMEYIQGDDLKHHLDRGVRYSLEQSLKMIRDLLSALDYAHKQGIVHRDIKPANLLLEASGRVKLTDFGVARIQDSGEATRTQGSMVGTLKYMSPEQVQGQKIDSRADLFSVGVVLYQLLTDKRPFDGDNDFSIIHQIIGHNPPPPSSFNARLPTAIDAVVARALAKNRDDRFATARDFASALQSAIRRAEDQTIVPPADPFKKADGGTASRTGSRAGSVPGSSPGTTPSMASGSTVTQELELVYWKDIKDSTDPEELHGFLEKFPAGIYADLARRRLRKLASGSSGDQTVLNGMPVPGAQADADMEATRLRSDTTPSMVRPATPPATSAPEMPQPSAEAAMEAKPESMQLAAQPGGADAIAEPPAPAAPAAAASAAAPAKAAKKTPVAAIAGIGVLVVAGVIAAMTMGGKGGDKPAPSVAASGNAIGAAPAASPASGAVVLAAASAAAAAPAASAAVPEPTAREKEHAAKAARPAASAPKRAASQPRPKAAVPAAVPEPARPASTPAVAKEEPKPAALPPPPPAVSPVEQCRDKVFLAKEFCLAEHCDKPGARNHPLCVKRREEIRLREDSKIKQGPQ